MKYKIPIIGTFAIKLLAMAKNTSITLGEHFDLFIQQALKQGRYKNASEVIRAGLRLLEHEEQKVRALPKISIRKNTWSESSRNGSSSMKQAQAQPFAKKPR